MAEINVRFEGGYAYINSEYNAEFVRNLKKKIGGARWTGESWRIPEEAIDTARTVMEDAYGHSDLGGNEVISVKAEFSEGYYAPKEDVVLYGKVIASASGRDSGARLGTDVECISGGVTSGGSVKNWTSVVRENSVFILRNVNQNLYERERGLDERRGIKSEIVGSKIDREKLIAEKERLLERIREIDQLLGKEE